jgi:hypothetical protein
LISITRQEIEGLIAEGLTKEEAEKTSSIYNGCSTVYYKNGKQTMKKL